MISGGTRLEVTSVEYRSQEDMRSAVDWLFQLDKHDEGTAREIRDMVFSTVGGNLVDLQRLMRYVTLGMFYARFVLKTKSSVRTFSTAQGHTR